MYQQEEVEQKGQIKFLNMYGDITIEWEIEDHAKMLRMIQKKLDDGHQFYIVKKRFFGLGKKITKIDNINQLSDTKVYIKDADAKECFENLTTTTVINDNTTSHEVVKNSRNAEEIAKSSTVCTKPPTRG